MRGREIVAFPPLRLLIVEDDVPLASGLRRILEAEGHAVDVTSRGEQAVLAAMLAAGWMARLFMRRLQGFTGDGLGATQQVCELAIYLALAWKA